LKETDMQQIVDFIDAAITNHHSDSKL